MLLISIVAYTTVSEFVIVGAFLFIFSAPIFHGIAIFRPFLLTSKYDRDESWRKSMNILWIANGMYVVTIIIYCLAIRNLLR